MPDSYAALVREASTGDRAAVERLLMRAQEVAYRFSLLVCGHPEDAEDVMQDALLKTLRDALRRLPPSQRIVIVLREMEGLSTREVATVTGISEANVKTRLHRARLTLRRYLEE